MLMKVQSKNLNMIRYYEDISQIFVNIDRHTANCGCATCDMASKKWSDPTDSLGKNGWSVYLIDIQQKDETIRTMECGPGDEVYLLDDRGQTIDKIRVPID